MNIVTILLGVVLVGLLVLEGVKIVYTVREMRRKKVDPVPELVGVEPSDDTEAVNSEKEEKE